VLIFLRHTTLNINLFRVVHFQIQSADHVRFKNLFAAATAKLSDHQQMQFQSSMRAVLTWTRDHKITAIGNEALPNRLSGKIAYQDVPIDVVDGIPALRDYINHLSRETGKGQISVAVLRVSREAARNFVIEILKSKEAAADNGVCKLGERILTHEAFNIAISTEIRGLSKATALTLINRTGEGREKNTQHSVAYRIRQYLNWLHATGTISFSGDDIRQFDRPYSHVNRPEKKEPTPKPKAKPVSKQKLPRQPKPKPFRAATVAKSKGPSEKELQRRKLKQKNDKEQSDLAAELEAQREAEVREADLKTAESGLPSRERLAERRLQTVPLPPICQDWRNSRYTSNSDEWYIVTTILGHVFHLWLNEESQTYAGGNEATADSIVRDLKTRLISRGLEMARRKLRKTITYQLCFNRTKFTGECAALAEKNGFTKTQIETLLGDAGRWLRDQKFSGQ
jgi:hypothetical protein